METLEQIKARAEAAVAGCRLEMVPNPLVAAQGSLAVDHEHAVAVATFLRDDEALRLDYLSNVTGVDWPKEGRLEAVYHLYSMALKHGPVILRLRTGDRADRVEVPSLTPVWRSGEFQEREIFDLYGIVFQGHPDLRRLLMWEEFVDFPMRRDYVEPDDYEYEPTAHDDVLKRAQEHQAAAAVREGAAPSQ